MLRTARTAAWLALLGSAVSAAEPSSGESLSHWRYVQDVPLQANRTAKLVDFVLAAEVFDGARADLGDLRLYDPSGTEVPYALRVRRPDNRDEEIPTRTFNRSKSPDGASELTLDLGPKPGEHNDVEVQLPGTNYRRHARLEGSDDGSTWRLLIEKNLLYFNVGQHSVDDRRLHYPPSRFRYLRVRVDRDPPVDKDPVAIGTVLVRERIEIPGEFVERAVAIGPREAVRADGGPGSAWMFDLGGDQVPCERLAVDVSDPEFVRNYHIEAAGPAGDANRPFTRVGDGLWRRRAGEPVAPMIAEFNEVTAARLKLVVTDHRNPPLNLHGATVRAAARQIIFADPGANVSALRLYYGNPKADPPLYDFARNLPTTLDPAPARVKLAERRENPEFRPEPKPFSERWPWLIYVVLGAISFGLALLIVNLAITAARIQDTHGADVRAG